MLHKSSDGTINDSAWHSAIRDVTLISFAIQKFSLDLHEDFFSPVDIDPDAWLYPPVATFSLAVPPIVAYPGRKLYPVAADGYRTEAADERLSRDRERLQTKIKDYEDQAQKCLTRILQTIPPSMQESIHLKDPQFRFFAANYQVYSLVTSPGSVQHCLNLRPTMLQR